MLLCANWKCTWKPVENGKASNFSQFYFSEMIVSVIMVIWISYIKSSLSFIQLSASLTQQSLNSKLESDDTSCIPSFTIPLIVLCFWSETCLCADTFLSILLSCLCTNSTFLWGRRVCRAGSQQGQGELEGEGCKAGGRQKRKYTEPEKDTRTHNAAPNIWKGKKRDSFRPGG